MSQTDEVPYTCEAELGEGEERLIRAYQKLSGVEPDSYRSPDIKQLLETLETNLQSVMEGDDEALEEAENRARRLVFDYDPDGRRRQACPDCGPAGRPVLEPGDYRRLEPVAALLKGLGEET